jgi:dynein heavy chain
MAREFQPYSNLWNITHKWKVGIVSWLEGAWESLDAEEAEKFIDDSSRTLMGVIRHFRERDHTAVLKIAEIIK